MAYRSQQNAGMPEDGGGGLRSTWPTGKNVRKPPCQQGVHGKGQARGGHRGRKDSLELSERWQGNDALVELSSARRGGRREEREVVASGDQVAACLGFAVGPRGHAGAAGRRDPAAPHFFYSLGIISKPNFGN